jgi:hypothetical protein
MYVYRSIGTIGSGYGDGNFSHQCPSCNRTVNKELLSLHKFIQDTVLLLGKGVPMPGTVLDIQSGEPQLVPEPAIMPNYTRTFPNRMIQLELRIKVLNLINPSSRSAAESPSMADVRDLIEKTTRNDQAVRRIDGSRARAGLQSVRRDAKITTRKMMSRYWENFSPFALDLCGAVMRQGVFIDKMVKLDWLHSPSARATMERLITKYHRFIRIMKKYPLKIAVPTLDVDLAWHTHQLSPKDYYEYTVTKTGKFIDHDDKIEESQLSESFEWTTKTYQELYKEVYSECTCWYCESKPLPPPLSKSHPFIIHHLSSSSIPSPSIPCPQNTTKVHVTKENHTAIRESQGSRLGKLLNVSSSQKLADTFHDSGTARLCPPDNSAHISAHNSVKTLETPERARITAYLRARQNRRLDDAYERAARRAQKKGRTLPPRDQYYDHWGYSYYSASEPHTFPPLPLLFFFFDISRV